MSAPRILVQSLGQSGFRFEAGGVVLYTDPYLTDSVAEIEGAHLRRLIPAPLAPEAITDAAWVLVSHDHLDHCDLDTLVPLAKASPECQFLAPPTALAMLRSAGIEVHRLHLADEAPLRISDALTITPVPAAHPEIARDGDGRSLFVGFVLSYGSRNIYFAGDTSPHPEIVAAVRGCGGVEVAFIPINERNHYKERQGIIGNMSVREAFAFTEELGAKVLVPMHYDLFGGNSVFPEEVAIIAQRVKPPFEIRFKPEVL